MKQNKEKQETEIELTDEQLAAGLEKWFSKHKNDKTNLWNRTKTGRTIKKCVDLVGNFRVKPRKSVSLTESKSPTKFSNKVTVTESKSPEKSKPIISEFAQYQLYKIQQHNAILEFKKNNYQRADKKWVNNKTRQIDEPPGIISFEEFLDSLNPDIPAF